MSATLAITGEQPGAPPASEAFADAALTVHALARGDEPEALAFLARRPLHTVVMAGFILDNGIESPLNRGSFYGCRDARGRLAGVALVGHATLLEACGEAALRAFARFARGAPRPHVIMGEQESVASFWRCYAGGREAPRLSCRELLMEQRAPVAARPAVADLRRAGADDLDAVVAVQARMAFEECGVDPLRVDPVGFRQRCRRRIERGRVWVVVRGGRLVFKADVMAETPEVVYLEGVHVDPPSRGEGLGLNSLAQLGRALLEGGAGSVCLMVKESSRGAQSFYRRAGYEFRCFYDTVYPAR